MRCFLFKRGNCWLDKRILTGLCVLAFAMGLILGIAPSKALANSFAAGFTARVSGGTGSHQANNNSGASTLSADGCYVVFVSAASNL